MCSLCPCVEQSIFYVLVNPKYFLCIELLLALWWYDIIRDPESSLYLFKKNFLKINTVQKK